MGEKSRRARRPIAVAAIGVIAAVFLSACSGSSLRGDFRTAFAGDEAIESFELSTADNMPFTDGLSAEVRARDVASGDELEALVDRLSAFARENGDDDVRITVEANALTVPVFADAAVSADVVVSALVLRDDERVDSVTLSASTDEERITSVSLHLADGGADAAAGAFELARTVPVHLEDVTGGVSPHLTIRADESIRIEGTVGAWLDDVEQVWTTVSSTVLTTGFRAEPGRLEIVLASEADLDAARARTGAGAADLVVVFASPLVELGVDASGDSVRSLLGALEPAHVAEVRSTWTNDERAMFFVDSPRQAASTAAALSSRPEAGAFATLSVTVGSPDAPSLSVTASPARLGDVVAAASEMLTEPDVASLVSSPQSTTLVLAGDATDAELERRLSALSGLAEEGARVCANRADGTGVCVNASP